MHAKVRMRLLPQFYALMCYLPCACFDYETRLSPPTAFRPLFANLAPYTDHILTQDPPAARQPPILANLVDLC